MRATKSKAARSSPGRPSTRPRRCGRGPRARSSDEEYKSFYKHISHDFEDPLTWTHNKVEGKLEYTSLLYMPEPGRRSICTSARRRAACKLYMQRVFIMDDAEQFLPLYLRFIKGVVDSKDLSLNVSREMLQKDPQVDKMKSALTKRALDMLKKLAKDNDAYQRFWNDVRCGAQGRPGGGLRQSRQDRRAAALLDHAYRHRDPGSVAGRLRVAA